MSFLGGVLGGKNDFSIERAYAPGTQATVQNFQPQLDIAGQNYGQANTGLNSLAAQLQQQMQGGGPNLANALLQQATGQNVSNQAALMAGQRGASQNAGLMARQIGQQGAQIQQQSAGQASINRLQQQLQAQGQLGQTLGLQGQLANQNLGINQGALTAQNDNISGATNNYNQQGMAQNSENAKINRDMWAGIGSSVLQGASMMGGANPMAGATNITPSGSTGSADISKFGTVAYNGGSIPNYANGGPVMYSRDNLPFQPMNMKQGGTVPGQPMYPGKNMPSNDTVPAMLTPQEIVLPLSVTQHPNAPEMAAEFVRQALSKRNKK